MNTSFSKINIFVVLSLIIYAISVLLRLFLGEEMGVAFNLHNALNVLVVLTSTAAILLDKRWGFLLFIVWQLALLIWDIVAPNEKYPDLVYLDIVSFIFWIVLFSLRENKVSVWKYFLFKNFSYTIKDTCADFHTSFKEILGNQEISQISPKVCIDLDVKTENNNKDEVRSDSVTKVEKNSFLKNRITKKIPKWSYFVVSLVILTGIIFCISKCNNEPIEYVYIEFSSGQRIIHSDMNCSNISKGTKPMKISELKGQLSYWNYYYCPKCTNPDFIKTMSGKNISKSNVPSFSIGNIFSSSSTNTGTENVETNYSEDRDNEEETPADNEGDEIENDESESEEEPNLDDIEY